MLKPTFFEMTQAGADARLPKIETEPAGRNVDSQIVKADHAAVRPETQLPAAVAEEFPRLARLAERENGTEPGFRTLLAVGVWIGTVAGLAVGCAPLVQVLGKELGQFPWAVSPEP